MFARKIFWIAAAAALCASLPVLSIHAAETAAAAESEQQEAKEYELDTTTFHMGTVVQIKVFGKTPEETKRFAQIVEDEVVRFDDMMSVHKDSPLNNVNKHAGEKVEVTPEIAEMTLEALTIADMTHSAFEPMIGPLVNLWKIGFGGDHVPSDEAIKEAIRRVDHRHVRVTEENGKWFMQIGRDQNVDMGAIAKGYIGQKLAEKLKAAGATHALLDLGGNIVAMGEKYSGTPWRIGLQSPDKSRGSYFAVVAASDTNVITSGAYERNFEKNGHRYGHILNPTTGQPVATDIASVTIVDQNGARADALCTALFAMGWEKAEAFLLAHPDVHAVLLRDNLKDVLVSEALRDKIQPYDPEVSIRLLKQS